MTPEQVAAHFPGSTITHPPTGSYRHLTTAITTAHQYGGTDHWTLPVDLADYLEDCHQLVTLEHWARTNGYSLAPCTTCGEPTLRRRSAGPITCRMTPGCTGRHDTTTR